MAETDAAARCRANLIKCCSTLTGLSRPTDFFPLPPRPVSGTRCNACEQEADKELPRIYTRPVRRKRNGHPYTQMTAAHCALGCWNMAAWRQRYGRTMGKRNDRHSEAAFQGLGWFSEPWAITCNATLSLTLIAALAPPHSCGLNLIYSVFACSHFVVTGF